MFDILIVSFVQQMTVSDPHLPNAMFPGVSGPHITHEELLTEREGH